jgi:hypothetical protein
MPLACADDILMCFVSSFIEYSSHFQLLVPDLFRTVMFLENTTVYRLTHRFVKVKVKVKQSHYRPGQALRVPAGSDYQISRHSAHDGGMAVRPTQRPPLPPMNYSWYSFLLEAE